MARTVIKLPTPPSTNHLFVNVPGRGRIPSRDYASWKKAAGYTLLAQHPIPIHGPVEIALVVEENNRRDIDNFAKPCLDLLTTQRVIDGDRCKIVRKIGMEWGDVEGVVVTITEARPYTVTYGTSPRKEEV